MSHKKIRKPNKNHSRRGPRGKKRKVKVGGGSVYVPGRTYTFPGRNVEYEAQKDGSLRRKK